MVELKKHFVNSADNIKEALRRLNNLGESNDIPAALTLFVIDDRGKMVGSLTDGDIRRGFLRDLDLSNQVKEFMNTYFHFLNDEEFDPDHLREIKGKGVKLLPILNNEGMVLRVIDFNKVKTVLPLEAVLMAGGRGQRLSPLTDTIPKPLLKVGNKSIIEYTLDNLQYYGIRNFYVTIRYLGNMIENQIGNGDDRDIIINYVKETKPLGTFGSVSLINDFNTDVILVMNSDLFTNIDIEDFYRNFIWLEADMSIATVPYTVDVPYAVLNLRNEIVDGLSEKPTYVYQSNAGIYLIKKELIKSITQNGYLDVTDFIGMMIKLGKKVIRYPIVGYWVDIGKPEDYQKVKEIAQHLPQ